MLIIILSLVLVVCSLHYFINHNGTVKLLRKIPGPKIKFFIGNALEILFLLPDELFYLGRNWAMKYNGIYRVYGFFISAINIYNPEDVEIVTSNMKYHEKSQIYKFLKPWLQDGLLLSSGVKWQQRRKILTAAFHFNVLQKYYPALDDNNQRLVQMLEETNGQTVDIVPILSEYTLNTICETAMGTTLCEETSGEGKSYKKAIYSLGKILLKRFVNLFYFSDFIFNLSAHGRKQKKYLRTIRRFTKNVIQNRKKSLRQNKDDLNCNELEIQKENEYNVYGKKKNRNAMLDLLILAEKEGLIDSVGIQEEVDTFMFEGHDTTSAGLTYCLLSLANDQAVQTYIKYITRHLKTGVKKHNDVRIYSALQEKAVQELKSIFDEGKRQATMEDLNNMRYLDCCVKESLRLYPPVHFISRHIPVDTVLSDYEIPAGAFCHIHIYDLHRQEHLFKNALKFDPDRFLPENRVGQHNYAYIPFSAGPRNCIGQKFAMMEMKSALSAILRNFKLLPVTKHSDLRFCSDLILRNSGPVEIKFIKRN